ncbi:P-loop NTPase fold protein [Clostridium estertheticum]|uniref:KAP NTPase domain-containing protein n=1 Tax=Clostridium estertheticum subsp. estertheticum TaxID=1552 RepID=A0A1J0GHF2_9CLOT|nr:P-loop NTPase fold protein [Clostridium estertheticum]APC40828.1 hypothetical protein A7L45_12470 [Clostridium estertheticum subsp. estertheticum]MBZ9617322.1 KAP family NTPase [Clostridium estertheticum subsp. laramiense]WAG73009.1 KAP family NTPase [Clostridium estertheticum]
MLENINILNFFEQIIFPNWYSSNKTQILLKVIAILVMIHLYLICRDVILILFKIKRFKSLIISMAEGIMKGIIYTGFGIFLKMTNIKIIENPSAPIYLYTLLSVVLTLYFIANIAMYLRSVDKIISELTQYLIYNIGFLLLLLGYVGRLDTFEGIIGVAIISLLTVIKNNQTYICKDINNVFNYIKQCLLKKIIKNKEKILRIYIIPQVWKRKLELIGAKDVLSFNEEEDIPITKKEYLYPIRRQQLSYLIGEFKERNFDEPFAMAITGRWGSGKTCFLNALKDELKEQAYFVFVEPKIENSMEKMLRNIKIQFNKIFIENGIYTGKSSSLKSYFDTIFYILGNQIGRDGFSVISKMFQLPSVGLDSFNEAKDKINGDIKRLLRQNTNKRIYILIDDLDRSGELEIFETFKFIKEILELNGCTILFFVDYEKIISGKITREYLDKFINDRTILEDISYIDMYEYYNKRNQIIFKRDFVESSEFIKVSVETLRRSFYVYIKDVIDIGLEKIEKAEGGDNESWIIVYDKLCLHLSNPRKFKKLIRELKRVLRIVNKFWFSSPNSTTSNLSNDDCVFVVFTIAFIKIIFEEEYEKLIFLKEIKNYFERKDKSKENEYVIKIIKNCIYNSPYTKETKTVLFNGILYYMFYEDVIDKVKTNVQKIEDSLKEDSGIEFDFFQEHLEGYFQYLLSIKEEKEFIEKFKNIIKYIESLENEVKISDTMQLITFIEKVFRYNNSYFIKNHVKEIQPLLKVPEQHKKTINKQFEYMIDGVLYQTIHYIVAFISMLDLKQQNYGEIKIKFEDVTTVEKLYVKLSDEYMKHSLENIKGNGTIIDNCREILIKLKIKILQKEVIKESLSDVVDKYFSAIDKALDNISEINQLSLSDALTSRINSINNEYVEFKNYDAREVITVLNGIKNHIKEDYKLIDILRYYFKLCVAIEGTIQTMKLTKKTIEELESVYRTLDAKCKEIDFNEEWWGYLRIRLCKIKLCFIPSKKCTRKRNLVKNISHKRL